MGRTSKLLITAWALAALFAEAVIVSGMWPRAGVLIPAVFTLAVVGVVADRRTVAPILAISYLVPVLIAADRGRYHVTYSSVWLAALLGAVVPGAGRGWALPRRWQAPLVCWVGGVCATTPIVVMRAVDSHWELLFRGRVPTEALWGLPPLTVSWVLYVALLLVVCVLWFDWLTAQDLDFVRLWVAVPLGLSAGALALVACYQLFVDVTYLNPTVYGYLKRASGTVLDGNAAGVLAACWIGGWSMFGSRSGGTSRLLWLAISLAMWLPVWATGSRTAFASAAVASVFSIASAARIRHLSRRSLLATALFAAALLGALTVVARLPADAAGPIGRLTRMLPSRDWAGAKAVGRELWERNGYGVAATRAIAAYPLFGIGVGSFNEMANEFAASSLPPDNAQNWYRHQIAELGVIGSLGWIAFLASFVAWMWKRRRDEQAVAARPLQGTLVAVGLVSLLGMPGQDPFVAITLATFAAWYVLAAGPPEDRAPTSRAMWLAVGAVVMVFAVGTTALAVGRLRLPVRIQRLGGDYIYGLSWPEPDGQGGEYRWARRRSTALVPVRSRSLELTLRTTHLDLASRPVRVRAWVDGKRVIDQLLTAGADSVSTAVFLPADERRVLVDTWADRAVQAPPPDGRELAVMVRWRFLTTSR